MHFCGKNLTRTQRLGESEEHRVNILHSGQETPVCVRLRKSTAQNGFVRDRRNHAKLGNPRPAQRASFTITFVVARNPANIARAAIK